MTALWLVGSCLVLGMVVARWGRPPANLAPSLHWWIINAALPAITLALVPRIHLAWDLWYLAASQWLVLLLALALIPAYGRHVGWSRTRIGCLVLVAGLGNTSFLGFPMIEALRGGAAMPLAVVADQAGAFLALAIGGSAIAATYATSGASAPAASPPTPRAPWRARLRRVATFPPFLALCAGVVVGVLGGWPTTVTAVLERLGGTLTPLALFSVGLHFRFGLARDQLTALAIALGYKLIIAPAVVWSVGWALGIRGDLLAIATLQSAMAPMISATIVADQHELDPPLANAVLGLGIVASLATVPLVHHWLGR